MFGNSAVYRIQPLRNWDAAHRFFTETPRPRGHKWGENERPLYNSRSHHYRIVVDEDSYGGYYDLVLYQTPLIRYYRPRDNRSTVLLLGYNSSASWKFLTQHGWGTWYRSMPALGGKDVMVPLSGHDADGLDIPFGWTARLEFMDRVLITEESAHCRVYARRSTDEDKEARAQALARMQPLLMLMQYRLDTFHAASSVCSKWGKPFGGGYMNYRAVDIAALTADTPDEKAVADLLVFSQQVYDVSLSNRIYNDDDSKGLTWNVTSGSGFPPLTPEEFVQALRGSLLRRTRLGWKRGKKDLGQFPTSLPRKYIP